MTDKQALREVAEKAISEEGVTWWSEDQLASDYGLALHKADAKFIAAANPVAVLALLDELEAAEHTAAVNHEATCSLVEENEEVKRKLAAAEKRIAELREWNVGLAQESFERQQRIAELSGQKRLIGWRASDYTDETSDPELAKNWAAAIGVLPIFEGDVNTKLSAAGIGKGE